MHVLKHLPRRVRDVLYFPIDVLDGKVPDYGLEIHVRAAAAE